MENKIRASGVGMICSVCPAEWEVTAFRYVGNKGFCELHEKEAFAAAAEQSKGYGGRGVFEQYRDLHQTGWSMTQGVKKDGKALRAR